MSKNRLSNAGDGEERLVELMDGFGDPCPFSVVRKKKDENVFGIVAGEAEDAVAVFHTPADSMDDEGHCAGERSLIRTTGLEYGKFKLERMALPQQALHLAPLVGGMINIYRLCGGKGFPDAEAVAKGIKFPVPMVRAALNEYRRTQG